MWPPTVSEATEGDAANLNKDLKQTKRYTCLADSEPFACIKIEVLQPESLFQLLL